MPTGKPVKSKLPEEISNLLIKFDSFRNYDGVEYSHKLHSMIRDFIGKEVAVIIERKAGEAYYMGIEDESREITRFIIERNKRGQKP